MQRIVNEGQTFVRREVSDEDAAVELAGEPYKIELIGLKGGAARRGGRRRRRRGRRRAAHHLRQRQVATAPARGATCAVVRTCRPPRCSATPSSSCAAAPPTGAAARRTRSCSGSTAPRGRPRTSSRPTSTGSPRPRSATTASSGAELDLFSLPRRAGVGPGGLPPQGRRHQARDGGLRPPPPHRGGLPVRRHPPHQQGRAVPHLGSPALLRRHHVPADGDRGHRVPPQGDELPDAQPDLPVARALLPRAAAAALRVRLGLPVREVRRRARADPGARHDPGRLATPTSPPSRRRPRSSTCCGFVLGLLRDFGLDDYYLELSTRDRRRQADKFIGSDEQWEHRDRGAARGGRASPVSSSCPTPVARPTTVRRSRSRPATRSAAPGRCRPSSTTSTSRRGSSSSTRRPTGRASSR